MAEDTAYLVADVGGTNTRIALGNANGKLSQLRTFANDEVRDLAAALEDAANTVSDLRYAVIAAAGPVDGDMFRLTNRDWSFSRSGLERTLGLERLLVVNDFVAMAHAVPALSPQELIRVGPGEPDPHGNLLVCGPGTGFGVSALVHSAHGVVAIATEAGHMRLGPASPDEEAVLGRLKPAPRLLSVEDVLSGGGLMALHRARGNPDSSPDAVIAAAVDGKPEAAATVADFMTVFGRVVGDLALAFDARGGVFIGSGVGRALVPFYSHAPFRRAFEWHPPYEERMRMIPIFVITHPYPGLVGALQIARETWGAGPKDC